jgi:2-C-methyl-D-erythritol 4-phosphate cytidylyltransferase/2-C-methyl-D-erythritol 2,4-cyclodiphosphate synthase
MKKVSLVILSAGSSTRFGLDIKKQWLRVDKEPLWLYVANKLSKYYDFTTIVITAHKDEVSYMRGFSDKYTIIEGGDTRQESMKNALSMVDTEYVMISDVARCCIPKEIITTLIDNINSADCIVPYLNVSDTVVYKSNTIDRDNVKLIQTPQLSKKDILLKALDSAETFTDDSSAIKNIGGKIEYIKGSIKSDKLTFTNNLSNLSCLKKPSNDHFVGSGFDVHQFQENKKMYLGGLEIESEYGFKAHSDGDVLIHALIDALLGASGGGDIGELFPDTDNEYKDISSTILLQKVVKFIKSVGYDIINVDITVMAEKPKLKKYKQPIKFNIAKELQIEPYFVNIKATTTEKLGFVGRGEGVAVMASATLKFFDWTKI